ncbi:MAG: TldD/PmbA family protein [Chloroflexota bacterium]|nr:TldD/PmbA family protein [Chloroflexota bacterium]
MGRTRGLLGRDEALQKLESALEGSPADATEIVLLTDSTEVTRYANSEIHQNVAQTNTRVAVRVAVGKATARVFTNMLRVEDLKGSIREATELARKQAPNPNFRHLPEPQQDSMQRPPSYFMSTADQSPEVRAEAVGRVIDNAQEEGLQAFGTYRATVGELAVASSTGVRSYADYTTVYLKALVEGPGGTGFGDAFDRDAGRIDAGKVAAQAVARCKANHSQAEIEPGEYEALFEPNAVADMVRFPVIWGMSARQLLDGQSFMSGRIGERVASQAVSIWDDPTDARCMPMPIDYEGIPSQRVTIINNGIAAGPVYDSQTAAEVGISSTGHASNPFEAFGGDPVADHIVMPTSNATLESMIRNIKHGVWVTRFHYTHCPDRKRVIATGTTRDGTFLIRDGEVVGALKNLRLEMGVLELLSSLQEVGEGKLCQDWWAQNGMDTTNYFLPAMRFDSCRFTGVTTF